MDRRKISRVLTQIENRDPKILRDLSDYFSKDSLRRTWCITGPAGVGKSSFLSVLSQSKMISEDILWLACDPSDAVTGGSLLGDRIRSSPEESNAKLFLRSLATRSTLAYSPAVRDMAIFGEHFFDRVWIETTGAGQTQQEVLSLAGLTIYLVQPESGDEVQWMKAGLQDLADLYVIHKGDLSGAQNLERFLRERGKVSVIVSSKVKSGFEDFKKAVVEVEKQINWAQRLKALHRQHAKDLYLEKIRVKAEKDFEKKKILNPYTSR